MKLLTCLLLLFSASSAFIVFPGANPAQIPLGRTHENHLPRSEECSIPLQTRASQPDQDTAIDCSAQLDSTLVDNDATNSTDLALPKPFHVGYGTQRKKGIVHWVAFPMLGLAACKNFADLGPKLVGDKHGACQKSFSLFGIWFQLEDCNPLTGLPATLLDKKGKPIKTCANKSFSLLCLKEGKIHGKGSCEDDPEPAVDAGEEAMESP